MKIYLDYRQLDKTTLWDGDHFSPYTLQKQEFQHSTHSGQNTAQQCLKLILVIYNLNKKEKMVSTQFQQVKI